MIGSKSLCFSIWIFLGILYLKYNYTTSATLLCLPLWSECRPTCWNCREVVNINIICDLVSFHCSQQVELTRSQKRWLNKLEIYKWKFKTKVKNWAYENLYKIIVDPAYENLLKILSEFFFTLCTNINVR